MTGPRADLFAVLALLGASGCGFSIPASGSDDVTTIDAPDGPPCSAACALGCVAGSTTTCKQLVPSNGIDPAWVDEGTTVLAPTMDLIINTDAGTILQGATPVTGFTQHVLAPVDCGGGASPIGIDVFGFRSIAIPEGVRVRVIGARALALVAGGTISIEGVLDASSGGECLDPPRCAGAGGFAGGLYDAFAPERGHGPGGGGPGYSMNGPGDESGGGGGGGCGLGGKGGDAGPAYLGGLGGAGFEAPSLVPLCGGAGGGAGGPASYAGDPGSRGGGGGGAVQLVSATSVTIGSSSALPSGIVVAGAGGQGDKAQTIDDGGGGGGAGGAILIEAPLVSIANGTVLVANGGGGAGGYNNALIATDGAESTAAMPGAAAGGPGVRRGGNGGALDVTSGEAAPGPVGDGGAGGGGGTGRIRINTGDAQASILGVLSPSAGTCTTQGTVTTR